MFAYTPYVLPFIFSAAILTYLCVYSFRLRNQIEVAHEFSLLVLSLTVWTICYALELVSTTLEGKTFWDTLKYLGSAPGPVIWFVFSLYYTNHRKWLTLPRRVVLAVFVFATIAVVFTNPLHHWYWTKITMVAGFPETQSEHGFYFWVYVVGSYVCILSSVVIYVIHYFRVPSFFRRQAVLMVLGGFAPLALRIPEDFLNLDLIPKLDNIVVALLISAVLFFIAIFRFGALEILPIAYELVVQNIKSGILVLNHTGHVVEINPYAQALIGSSAGDVIGKPFDAVLSDWPHLGQLLQSDEHLENEISLERNGKASYFLVQTSPIYDKQSVFSGHVIIFVDITDRKQAEMEMERLTRTDFLTGVTNRRHFFEEADKQFDQAQRYDRPLAVMMLDVDHFKSINDRYGHLAGDAVLQHIAAACQKQVRNTDIFARYGGEEFIGLLPEQTEKGAYELAERIRRMIEQTEVRFETQSILVTASLGLAINEKVSQFTLEQMIDHADQALYQSKSSGRNRTTLWQAPQANSA